MKQSISDTLGIKILSVLLYNFPRRTLPTGELIAHLETTGRREEHKLMVFENKVSRLIF
jgi:hypothetical protein